MNANEYLGQVYRLIQENFRTNDATGGMPAATVAYLVKQSLSDDYKFLGFPKFKDVLNSLELRGLIRTGNDSKQALAVWLTPTAESSATGHLPLPLPPRPRLHRLKREVWFAFLAGLPAGGRYLNRKTGQVRVGVPEKLPSGEWAEIFPIDPELDREEARQFIKEKNISDPEIVAAIDSPRWYVDFPTKLSVSRPTEASEWNYSRSSRTIALVNTWCESNGIDHELVFQPEFQKHGSARARAAMQRIPTTSASLVDRDFSHERRGLATA